MFKHIKELQYEVRVEKADPRFATMLLEQFGGPNGELKAAMQYFVQSFAARQSDPERYDLLMDIATEEFSHLEMVGTTIQMLLNGINGELKHRAESSPLMNMLKGSAERDAIIQEASVSHHILAVGGGGPVLTNSDGYPWSGSYVNADGNLEVDLRSNIAAEARAKIVYEYLMRFTDDQGVKDTLGFLMCREIAHMNAFTAALDSIPNNFPPGALQGDPVYNHQYFNMSDGQNIRGPWNQGQGPWPQGEQWEYVDKPEEWSTQSPDAKAKRGKTLSDAIQDMKKMMQGADTR